MLKILYMLPALALLGLIPAADAATDQELQEKIDRLQAKIDKIQAKIDAADPDRDAKRIDKWEKKIAKHEGRIAELEAKLEPAQTATYAEKPATTPQEPKTSRSTIDDTPPTVLSATLDLGTGTLAIVFDEAIDLDRVRHDQIEIYDTADPGNNVLDLTHATTQTSDPGTLSVTFGDAYVGHVGGWSNVHLTVLPGSVYDAAGVGIGHVSGMPVTVTPARDGTPDEETPGTETSTEETPDDIPMIATVTIAADLQFENSGTVELEKSDLMGFSINFVNNHDVIG